MQRGKTNVHTEPSLTTRRQANWSSEW